MKYQALSFLFATMFVCITSFTPFAHGASMAPELDSALTTAETKPPMSTAPQSTKKGSLEEQLAENPKYILATKLLQSTIDLLETRITPEQHKRLSQWQYNWNHGEKDAEVAKHAKTMDIERAHIKATVERMRVLIRIAAVIPATSDYENANSFFSAQVHDGTVTIQGTARNAAGETCSFHGLGALNKGWMQISNQNNNDFYVLFTPKAAFITYVGDNASVGCPENVYINGAYSKQ